MKKIFFLCALLLCAASTALAAPVWGNGGFGGGSMMRQMERVAVLYENNAGTTFDAALDRVIENNVNNTIFQLGNQSVDGKPYIEELHKRGITELAEANPAEIFALFNNTGINYVLYIEVREPAIQEQEARFATDITCTMKTPVRFFSIKERRELFNDVLVGREVHNSIGGGASRKNVAVAALAKSNPFIEELLKKYLS